MSSTVAARQLSSSAYREVFAAAPVALLVIEAAGLVMKDANAAYLAAVGMTEDQVVGRHVFDVFPNSPLREDDQTLDLRSLFSGVIESGEQRVVRGLRYDIPSGAGFESRWWNAVEVPIRDASGVVTRLLHVTEDVTELVAARDALALSQAASARATRQVTSLADVALALTAAETVEALQTALVTQGLPVLEAASAIVVARSPTGDWVLTVDPSLVEGDFDPVVHLPYDGPSPGPTCAHTGERILLPDRASGLALSPEMGRAYAETGRSAWAFLPLIIGGESLGAMAVAWTEEREFSVDELDLLDALAAQCAQTLSRIQAADERRRTARRMQDLAEVLQSAMLTEPPRPADLEIVVRYRSAVDVAQVGGDWYDAFLQPDGSTTVVIGDVVGHDDVAAGKMGQLRGLLRALAYDADDRHLGQAPSAVLSRFERAARGLAVDELATAILARIEPAAGPTGRGTGRRVLRWSNAGNPPPVLVHRDGTTRLLDPKPDLLLGVDVTTDRHDHTVDLEDGCTLLLYTDGLVERRDASIDDGIADLRRALGELAGAPLDVLCDGLLDRLAPHIGEDDVALVAVRGSA